MCPRHHLTPYHEKVRSRNLKGRRRRDLLPYVRSSLDDIFVLRTRAAITEGRRTVFKSRQVDLSGMYSRAISSTLWDKMDYCRPTEPFKGHQQPNRSTLKCSYSFYIMMQKPEILRGSINGQVLSFRCLYLDNLHLFRSILATLIFKHTESMKVSFGEMQ